MKVFKDSDIKVATHVRDNATLVVYRIISVHALDDDKIFLYIVDENRQPKYLNTRKLAGYTVGIICDA